MSTLNKLRDKIISQPDEIEYKGWRLYKKDDGLYYAESLYGCAFVRDVMGNIINKIPNGYLFLRNLQEKIDNKTT